MSARPPAPRADLPEGEATLKDAEQPETSLEARGSRGPGPFIKSLAAKIGLDSTLPVRRAESRRVPLTTYHNPSRARCSTRAICMQMHAAAAKLAANRTDRAGAFQNTNPAARRRRARHSLLRANNWALATSCMGARASRRRARAGSVAINSHPARPRVVVVVAQTQT